MRTIIFLLFSIPLLGQNANPTQLFSLQDYLGWVRDYHPVMQQANLLENRADASLLESRGQFDPKWFGNYEDKSFDQKNYFRVGEAGLKVPTWWGVDVKFAYLWSNGIFLNPEATLPSNGQAVLGVEVPLLQGLVFDQRRAQVQQAKLLREGNEAQRRSVVNDLLLEATEAYWQWAYHYQVVSVYRSALTLTEDRFELIKSSFLQGDVPAIDTLEAMIQIQNRNLQLSQANVDLQTAALTLSNYLWTEDLIPLEVSDQLRPESISENLIFSATEDTDFVLQNLSDRHPDLQVIRVKQEQLEVKERLKLEQFKPRLQLSYDVLGNGFDLAPNYSDQSLANNLFLENYKWGLELSYPLMLRKERAGLELVKLEQLETNYKFEDKQLQISNKIKGLLQAINTNLQQIDTQQAMFENYQTLLDAENEKFRVGESSVFLLNNREQKLIESQLKLNKLQSDFQKLRWKLDWAKGILQ